ncbi:MAG TPA: DUF4382 domain-containing protein [Longimicrobiales bacterium]|nr:DUF4382 domain-containing protein [Longimicrobiales bacterium]
MQHWKKLVAVTFVLGACDGTGPGDSGEMDVRLSSAAVAGGSVSSVLGESAGSMGSIALEAVDSIHIELTGIDAIRSVDGEESIVRLNLREEGTQRINLLAIPTVPPGADDLDDDSWTVTLARGDVPAGTYNGVRLRYEVASATVTLNRSVTVGQHTFEAGTHVLEIPSGAQTGIKIPFQSVVIGDDLEADVLLTFEPGTTVQNVVATGSGKLMMPPVLKARAELDDD